MGYSQISNFAAAFFDAEVRAWLGEQPLWKAFWVYGVAASGALIALYGAGFYVDRIVLRQELLLTLVPYTVWILVSVWRCANDTENEFWGLMARLLTVARACNTILIVLFLQFNLLGNYLHN